MAIATPSTGRVERNTDAEINRRIRLDTEARVAMIGRQGPLAAARRRDELEREWDIERALEANASSLVLLGSVLALTDDRRWAAVPAIVGAFLLQHALQGWCPPLPLLRRLGFRTRDEINEERMALNALPFGDERQESGSTP
ncbi:MAG TPA: DUF2892 domain-containing protein [Zeimonas sp.]